MRERCSESDESMKKEGAKEVKAEIEQVDDWMVPSLRHVHYSSFLKAILCRPCVNHKERERVRAQKTLLRHGVNESSCRGMVFISFYSCLQPTPLIRKQKERSIS